MEEETGQVLKSVGFPIPVLKCLDMSTKLLNTSRSALVVRAVKEFIRNHKLDKKTNIKI